MLLCVEHHRRADGLQTSVGWTAGGVGLGVRHGETLPWAVVPEAFKRESHPMDWDSDMKKPAERFDRPRTKSRSDAFGYTSVLSSFALSCLFPSHCGTRRPKQKWLQLGFVIYFALGLSGYCMYASTGYITPSVPVPRTSFIGTSLLFPTPPAYTTNNVLLQ